MTTDFFDSVPVLQTSGIAGAIEFYCDRLGFTRRWLYQPNDDRPDPAYMGLNRGGARLHVSSFSGDGVIGGVATFHVSNIDALFEEYSSRGVKIDLEPYDQTWGNREMYLQDPDGNRLRFVQGEPD